MIISASRRTDIPAFYSEWFFNRLRDGYCLVRNPFNYGQISRVPLTPDVVDCIVFWSKNPEPMMRRLDELDRIGIPYYFQFTLTPYGSTAEPHLPDKKKLIETFRELSRMVGRDRMVWRYDPILLTDCFSPAYHSDCFKELCEGLRGYTDECMISFADRYEKTNRNAPDLIPETLPKETIEQVARSLSETAEKQGLRLRACSEETDLTPFGIQKASCIDRERIESILGCPIRAKKDKTQRPGCACIESVDIGAYNTCPFGCRYCYANQSEEAVRRRRATHDPDSPLLYGSLNGDEKITPRKAESMKLLNTRLY